MSIIKGEFCNTDHHTLPEVKNQLHALLSDVMMDDTGYILDKSIYESKKEMAKLRIVSSQIDNQKKSQTPRKKVRTSLYKHWSLPKEHL